MEKLQKVLRAFSPPTGPRVDRAELLLRLQKEGRPLRSQSYYEEQLRELDLLLASLHKAAGKRPAGLKASTRVHQWVWMAADSWQSALGTAPSASPGRRDESPFVRALLSLQSDEKARDVALPQVSQAIVAAALKEWTQHNSLPTP